MKQIKVINYGLSNLLSVQRAFEHLGAQVEFVNTPDGVLAAEALVLPEKCTAAAHESYLPPVQESAHSALRAGEMS